MCNETLKYLDYKHKQVELDKEINEINVENKVLTVFLKAKK